jgi:hypothetical protein
VSFNAVRAVIRASSADPGRFSNAEFRLLVALAHHRNHKTGQCNPGSKRLAVETGFSKSYVVKMLDALERRGEIRSGGSSKGGYGHSKQFDLTLRKGHSRVTLWDGEKGHSATPFSEVPDDA